MSRILAFLVLILLFSSCSELKNDKSTLPKSSGKYGEVLVVVDTIYENRKTGNALQEIFYKALEGMPQQESQFRMSTVPPKSFKSILKRSRNVLKLNIGKGKKNNIVIKDDVWAKDQLLLQITAAGDEDAARILRKNTQTIRNYFNEKEISRLQDQFNKKPQKELMEELEKKYSLQLTIPPGFVKMKNNEKGFWLKKEKSVGEHKIFQGLSMYFYPYESDSVFENKEMVKQRNTFTKDFIQGSLENSYMTVYSEYDPVVQEINLNGKYAMEYRGLWNMENDFMGGPFLHYTFVDEKNNRVINLDGFVFAPKFNKREYLRELEALMKTIDL